MNAKGLHRLGAGEWGILGGILVGLVLVGPAAGQIGGKTAADGPFVLEDAEDRDLFVDALGRDWIPDFVPGDGNGLTTLTLAGSGLTLAAGQTPVGALKFAVPQEFGFIDKGFGVPMPGVVGASTLASPGDITSFERLEFLFSFNQTLNGQVFQVILETYPEVSPGVFPQIFWSYTAPAGGTFHPVALDLRSPDLIENAGGRSLEELLGQTRFLFFYFFAGPVGFTARLEARLDDVTLAGEAPPPLTAVPRWELRR